MPRQLELFSAFRAQEYAPHAVQQRVHAARAQARFRAVDLGRRTGKSNLGGHELAYEAMRARLRKGLSKYGRRAEYWIVGPEYSDGEKEFRVLYDTLTRMGGTFDKPGTYYNVAGSQMDISLFDGQFQVHVKSAKYPNTLVGEALEGVILAEAAKLKATIWPKFIRPMLSDYHGWGLMTSTPEGKNWFYEQWRRGQDTTNPEYWSIKAPSWTNTLLYPGGRQDPEIISMERDMPTEKFKQEIGADFTEYVGRVFKNYDPELSLRDCMYDPRYPLYMAADYGYTNPTAILWLQIGPFGEVYVLAEYYRSGRNIEQIARDVESDPRLAALARASVKLYGDHADPGASDYLSERWKVTVGRNTGGTVDSRINLIRRWLEPVPFDLEDGHPDKLPKLFVDYSCSNLDREMQDYRYPETREEAASAPSENPMKKDDHAPEALGRFFGGHFHNEKPRRRTRQTIASMS